MTSAGVVKTAIAFIIGVALALGGVRLYTHFAPHPAETEQLTATVPAVPDGLQRLPDDDAPPPPPVKPPVSPVQTESSQPASTLKQPAPPPPTRKPAPVHSASKKAPQQPKPRVETAHLARRPLPRNSKPPLLLARNTAPQSVAASSAPTQSPAVERPVSPIPAQPNSQPATPEQTPEPALGTSPAPVAPPEPAPAPRQPRTVTISAGTALNIRLNQALSSDHNFAGDTFQGTLQSPIILDNALVAERGSKVTGKVVNVQRGGRGDSGSDLSLTLTYINTTDGQRVPVQTSIYNQQTSRNAGRDAAKVGGGAALGAIIGAIAGGGAGAAIGAGVGGAAGVGDVVFTHGRPAALQPEAQITFRLSAPVTLTERINADESRNPL